jgi:hypothetical protein
MMARYIVEMTSDLALLLKNAGQVKIIETLQEDGLELDSGPAPIKQGSSVPTTPPISGPRVEESPDPIKRDIPYQVPPTPGARTPRRARF